LTTPGSRARPATGADLLVSALEAAGVEVVFGLPGVHNLPLWRSLASSRIRLVTVRHEQTAAYAADGYARSTGRVGVALTTTGPGAANTLGAVGEAWAARSPVVVIATDIPSTIRRPGAYRGALHEMTDQGAMFAPLVKQVLKVTSPGESGPVLARALAEAARAPARPVYVEIPTDFLAATASITSSATTSGGDLEEVGPAGPDDAEVAAAVELIECASRPLLWAGGGAVASGGGPAIGSLAERLVAPVFTTYQARGLLGRAHPCAVGLPPHLPSAGALWDEADLVLAIGSDLDGMMTQNWRMPPPPVLVTINVDPVDASKNYRPDLTVTADATRSVKAITGRLQHRPGIEVLHEYLEKLRREAREVLVEMHPDAVGFLDSFDSAVPPEAVVVADMCIPGYWLAGFHPVSGPRRFAYPVGWGTLGFGFPAAIGAAVGAGASAGGGGSPVVSVSGDGGFLFACGDLATVAQEQPSLTIVIVDDGGYGMLRYDQRKAGDEIFGVDLVTPDFVALARSFGLQAEGVDGLGKEFGEALGDAIATPTPSVLVSRAALEPPPTTSPRWYRVH
jgi:thiamine pyrophosphate-dependent acetolactate synthase large subunit-like protein